MQELIKLQLFLGSFGNGFDNTLGPYGGDGFGGLGPARPFMSRCDDGDNFKQVNKKIKYNKKCTHI